MGQKVLLVTETIAGSGHYRAAEAIMQALSVIAPDIKVKLMTTMPLIHAALEKTIKKVYLNTLKVAPKMWGWVYESEKVTSSLFKERWARTISYRLETFLQEERPDVVVCTHAFSLGAFAFLKQKYPFFLLGAAMTDFGLNGFWVHSGIDFYLVSHESLKNKLTTRFLVSPSQVYVTGIPIGLKFTPAFAKQSSVGEIRERMGISEEMPVLLLTGGGTGYGPLDELVVSLDKIQLPFVIIAVAGHNTELYLKLLEIKMNTQHRVDVYEFVDNMEALMSVSEFMISKPGGLSVSEALAKALPLIIYDPIPGQEKRNSRFLTAQKVAVEAKDVDEAAEIAERLLRSPELFKPMQEAATKLSKPYAALDAAEVILQYVKRPVEA